MNLSKLLQRRLYTFVNSRLGFCLCLYLGYSLLYEAMHRLLPQTLSRQTNNVVDNIGRVNMRDKLSYGPIDIVYTWVNGSDPVWLAQKARYLPAAAVPPPSSLAENATVTGSGQSLNDSSFSSARYRDNDELRYSLRSIEKNAPWARHVYLVTDNQVPHWLNLEGGKISIVSHADIFANKSHLPVFSSPAIEAHLHRIPGLSRHFIYFNDDVLLGAPTLPEDFLSVSGVQKFHLSWEVPKCAPGCSDSWIGDGYCDKACNVSSCNFDFPDCVNGTDNSRNSAASAAVSNNAKSMGTYCAKGCTDGWLGDKVCDMRCRVPECAFDVGDCGINLVAGAFPSARVSERTGPVFYNRSSSSASGGEGGGADAGWLLTPASSSANAGAGLLGNLDAALNTTVLRVPLGTKAILLNVSYLVCFTASPHHQPQHCAGAADVPGAALSSATFEDNPVVHTAVLSQKHQALIVTLYSTQDERPAVDPLDTHRILFTLRATNSLSNVTVVATLAIEVVPDEATARRHLGFPLCTGGISESGMRRNVTGHAAACLPTLSEGEKSSSEQEVLELPIHEASFADRPFSLAENSTSAHERQGVALLLAVEAKGREGVWASFRSRNVAVIIATTAPDGSTRELRLPLCSSVGTVDINSLQFQRAYGAAGASSKPCPQSLSHMLEDQGLAPTHQSLLHVFRPLRPRLQPSGQAGAWVDPADVFFLTLLLPVDSSLEAWGTGVITATTGNSLDTSRNRSRSSGGSVGKNIGAWLHSHVRIVSNAAEVEESVGWVDVPRGALRNAEKQLACVAGSFRSACFSESVPSPPPHPLHLAINDSADGNDSSLEPIRSRRLFTAGDTYAASLIHVNRLYTKAFGAEQRKVPAHLPHMIDAAAMNELQSRWSEQWDATSSHRFRSPDDMQYAFAYYYFVMNRGHAANGARSLPEKRHFLKTAVDTNGDGFLDDNELRTLATIVKNKTPKDEEVEALRSCALYNSSSFSLSQSTTESSSLTSISSSSLHRLQYGALHKSFSASLRLFPSLDQVLHCVVISDALASNVAWTLRHPTHSLGTDKDISFEMIGDNVTAVLTQLDSIRARQSKFICVNDNIQTTDPAALSELTSVLHDFFESFFPKPSQFELPAGVSNPTLYWDEYAQMRPRNMDNPRRAVSHWSWQWLATASNAVESRAADVKVTLVGFSRKLLLVLLSQLPPAASSTAPTATLDRAAAGLRRETYRPPEQSGGEDEERGGAQNLLISTAALVTVGLCLRALISRGLARRHED